MSGFVTEYGHKVQERHGSSPVRTSKYADPLHNDKLNRARKRRGIGNLVPVDVKPASPQHGAKAPGHGVASSSTSVPRAHDVMSRMVNGEHCWAAETDPKLA